MRKEALGPMRRRVLDLAIIWSVSSVILFWNLGSIHLLDRDEARNAECALEMLQRGDWITPIFNDELRHHKPVLIYWLIMSAYGVFGVNEFAARFWSAALGLVTITSVYYIGERLFNRTVAVWSALVLATCLMFDAATRIATPDSPLVCCVTLSLAIYVVGTFRRRSESSCSSPPVLRVEGKFFPTNLWLVVVMFAVMSLGVLAKGPVGFLFPSAIIGLYMLLLTPIQKRDEGTHHGRSIDITIPTLAAGSAPLSSGGKFAYLAGLPVALVTQLRIRFNPVRFFKACAQMRLDIACVVLFVVALPWYVWVGLRTEGDFLELFFLREHFGRATSAFEGHSGGLYYYPLAALISCFPWSIFAIPILINMVRSYRQRDPWTPGYTFCLCWVCMFVGVFSLAKTKLPSYITPCIPAMALIIGCFIYQLSTAQLKVGKHWIVIALAVFMLIGLGVVGGSLVAIPTRYPDLKILAWLGLIPLAGGAYAMFSYVRDKPFRSAVATLATAVCLYLSVFAIVPDAVERHRKFDQIVEVVERSQQTAELASYGILDSGWVYYSNRPVHEVIYFDEKLVAAEAMPTRDRPWHKKPKLDIATYFRIFDNGYLITTGRLVDEVKQRAPEEVEVIKRIPFFPRQEHLVLMGRPATQPPDEHKTVAARIEPPRQ